jgi:hydrogenase maturation protease
LSHVKNGGKLVDRKFNSLSQHRRDEAQTTRLVIGYGNPLRGDDGIGQQVAEAVALWNLPQVRSIAAHQLTPELAEELSRVDCAIFVDACIDSETFQITPLLPNPDAGSQLGHYTDPRSLLALAEILYGKAPQAWLVAIPGVNFELGVSLSTTAREGVEQALVKIRELVVSG